MALRRWLLWGVELKEPPPYILTSFNKTPVRKYQFALLKATKLSPRQLIHQSISLTRRPGTAVPSQVRKKAHQAKLISPFLNNSVLCARIPRPASSHNSVHWQTSASHICHLGMKAWFSIQRSLSSRDYCLVFAVFGANHASATGVLGEETLSTRGTIFGSWRRPGTRQRASFRGPSPETRRRVRTWPGTKCRRKAGGQRATNAKNEPRLGGLK